MNCTQCGAPLPPTEHAEQVICDYCSAQCLTVAGFLDGLILADGIGTYDCPCCQLPLSAGTTQGVPLQVCEKCHGILFPAGAFAIVVSARRRSYEGPETAPPPIPVNAAIAQRNCPECRSPMSCHPYYGPGNAVIDHCANCSIVWLDRGELTQIERAPGRR